MFEFDRYHFLLYYTWKINGFFKHIHFDRSSYVFQSIMRIITQ